MTGRPAGRPGTGELVRIWLSVGLGCSARLKGLVGDGVLRPERKGLRVLAACGGATKESRLTREEAAGPRKASGVLQSFRSLQDSARESARLVRSKLFAPSCLVLGNRSPKGSSSAGLLDLAEEGGCECSGSGCSAASGGFANRSKASPPAAGGKR